MDDQTTTVPIGISELPTEGRPKDKILYGRAYRKLPSISKTHAFFTLLFIIVVDTAIFIFRRKLTWFMSWFAWKSAHLVDTTANIAQVDFMYTRIFAVDTVAVYPSAAYSFLSMVVSFLALALLTRVQRTGVALAYWLFYMFVVHLSSSVFFLFFPQYFPYSILEITGLYMQVELVTWMLIPPMILGAVFLYPTGMLGKFLLVVSTLGYSMLFGAIRLAVFLFVLYYGSVIFMAILFFVFGSLVDFIYIVGFYSFYISRTAKNLADRQKADKMWKWKWLF